VIADTCGFHARADSHRPSLRIEIWAYCRGSPFLPWTQGGLLSWRPLADRRMQWLSGILDQMDKRGWAKQHWRAVEPRRLADLLKEHGSDVSDRPAWKY
jgi:hypothetical protein